MNRPTSFDPDKAFDAIAADWPGGETALVCYVHEKRAAAKSTAAPLPKTPTAAGAIIDPQAFYRPEEASRVTPWSVRTFEAWRAAGKGPAFSKVAGRILYRGADLLAFLEDARRPSGGERRARQQQRRATGGGG